MNERIETFLNYVFDTDLSSTSSLKSEFKRNKELFNASNVVQFSRIIDGTIHRWDKVHQAQAQADTAASKNESDSDRSTDSDSSEDSTKPKDDDDDDDDKNEEAKKKPKKKIKAIKSIESSKYGIEPSVQCDRLLQFLYQSQQYVSGFAQLYFEILGKCVKNDAPEIVFRGVEQIARHLADGARDKERHQLRQCLSSLRLTPTISKSLQSLLNLINMYLSSDGVSSEDPQTLHESFSTLYPYRAHYIDVRREFRDSAQYLIDGDSLLLYVAHHANVNLRSAYGNTLHVIYIIERLLEGLFNQSRRANYIIVFFDCNYEVYRENATILDLIRACLIAHLTKNKNKLQLSKVASFISWINDDYHAFLQNEKPMFILYHNMLNLSDGKHQLIPNHKLNRLRTLYHVFGNYHQSNFDMGLYIMNKLSMTNMSLECFRIIFKNAISKQRCMNIVPSSQCSIDSKYSTEENQTNYAKVCRDIGCDDVRLLIYLRAIRILMLKNKGNGNKDSLPALCIPFCLLHVALLLRLSLSDRHLPDTTGSLIISQDVDNFIKHFQQELGHCLRTEISDLCFLHVADLFDGRLFMYTFQWLHQASNPYHFDSETMGIFKRCLDVLGIVLHVNDLQNSLNTIIDLKGIHFLSSVKDSVPTNLVKKQQVVKVSNSLVDTYLAPIFTSSADDLGFDLIDPNESKRVTYTGKHHWHVYKEVGDEIDRVRDNDKERKDDRQGRYKTKSHQKFYQYFTLYGNSLTTRDVKETQLQISAISLPSATGVETASASASSSTSKKSAKSGKFQTNKADLIREQNKQRKLNKQETEENEKLNSIQEHLNGLPSDSWSEALDYLDQHLLHCSTPSARLQLLTLKFSYQRKYLRALRKTADPANEQQSKLQTLQIALFATMTQLAELEKTPDPFVEKRKYMEELMNDSGLDVDTWYRFQMETINSCLPRREISVSDPRTPDFTPDQWQVKFLDAVDKRQTIIIVAPTASGKTYASYYAMKKVLNDAKNPNGICVYVAPTKALVNQVAATVFSKFGAVFGIFTRDFRVNMDASRILVTVPQCLEILLLSSTYQRWCQRIQYVIFDEIHCMSGEISSDVWERTMSLINCPMIGLSATVNNGEDLCVWLRHLEQRRASLFKSALRDVTLIVHHERMADLNKYVYAKRELHPIHPVGLMNSKELATRGIPKDFSLSPKETIQLKDAILHASANATSSNRKVIPSLREHFSPAWVIERSVCNDYSRIVRDRFQQLIDEREDPQIDRICQSLNTLADQTIVYPEEKNRSALIIDFVATLKEKDLLPCIVFSDSRSLCEQMAVEVASHFSSVEQKLRETKYKQQIEALKQKIERNEKIREKAVKMADKLSKSSKGQRETAEEAERRQATVEEMISSTRITGKEWELLHGILPEGTLANRYNCDQELVEKFIERSPDPNELIVQLMRRGVAYHHAGLNNRSRVAVEALFRNRYVQIVFSTSTLALGVHMPTKSVAFLMDSIYLDALQYRQSSGRAGRRGFDIQGHVIFLDIPVRKIRHLMMSSIPNIEPHFPITITFIIRLLHLFFHGSDQKDASCRALISLENPFMLCFPSINRDLIDTQCRFHALHTLDFLNEFNLIDEKGDLIGLAGLATHLHYFQPSNIALVYLIDSKLFHQLSDDDEIVTILAYLFTHFPWLNSKLVRLETLRKTEKYNSMLFLPPVSLVFRQLIDSYNSKVKEIYGSYIENVARRMRKLSPTYDSCLPLSGISFTRSTDYDSGTFEYQLHHHHSQQTSNPSISPFAGLSGLTHENFMSNYHPSVGSWDLAYQMDLSKRVIPYLDVDCRDHTNATYPLNSYALDFFRNGSQKLLETENELQSGDIYNFIFDFFLALSSIRTSLAVIIDNEQKLPRTNDLNFFRPLFDKIDRIHENYWKKFNRQFPRYNRL